jgi:iron-sulfur cluster repair protein YtfE (RIC family)
MNNVLEFPAVDCEPEWQQRPVSAIATHISLLYHEYTRDRLPLIASLAKRVATISSSRRTA